MRRFNSPVSTTSIAVAGSPEGAAARWGTYPIRSQGTARRAVSGVSKSRTCPALAAVMPSIVRISVDLPEPFAPSSAIASPAATRRLTSCSTRAAS